MYDLPGTDKVSKCVITRESILGLEKPRLIEGKRKVKVTEPKSKTIFPESKKEKAS
jgi:ATP-dependent protease Clp ATPase subunit